MATLNMQLTFFPLLCRNRPLRKSPDKPQMLTDGQEGHDVEMNAAAAAGVEVIYEADETESELLWI